MATFAELLVASRDDKLRENIRVACIIAADAVRTETPQPSNHGARMAWAKAVFANPEAEGNRMIMAVLAQNKAFTLAQIVGATDATVLACVMLAIDTFAS